VISGNFDVSFICCGDGGGINLGGNGAAEIIANTIINNRSSGNGAGIALNAAGTPIISNNIISGNITSFFEGGGIALSNVSDAEIVQNLIISNTASNGGGIYSIVPFGARGPRLINNTIADNNSASQIFADGFDAQAELINNIVVGNSGQTAVFCGNLNDTNPPIFRFNNIFSPLGTTYGGICTDQTGINSNISNRSEWHASSPRRSLRYRRIRSCSSSFTSHFQMRDCIKTTRLACCTTNKVEFFT
jgi:parallel beta-helix repeat protein